MRIATWNVNGIRAVLAKEALDWAWVSALDVVCLQEVKARPEQLSTAQHDSLKLPFIWNAAERPGYSGVATFFRQPPDEVCLGLDDSRFDAEGRVIRSRHRDIVLYNVYFPSGQRGRERVDTNYHFMPVSWIFVTSCIKMEKTSSSQAISTRLPCRSI